jgi:predicted GNAT family acetyltransferase
MISLLSCLGKLVEKVATSLITESIEQNDALHIGQFGGCQGQSVADVVSVLVVAVEDAWEQKRVTAALIMDVKGTFPTINHTYLLSKMRGAGLDENLVTWVDSFISD